MAFTAKSTASSPTQIMPYKQPSRIKPSSFLLPLGRLDTFFFQPSAAWMGTQNPQASLIVDKSGEKE
jgi:hypothetical protein